MKMKGNVDKSIPNEASYRWLWGSRVGIGTVFGANESSLLKSGETPGAMGRQTMTFDTPELRLEGDKLFLGDKDVFQDIEKMIKENDALLKQGDITAGLPEEDLLPGHVMPAMIHITSTSA